MSTTQATVDLAPFARAVPDAVVDRLRASRNVLAVCHEHPEADALGAALGICLLVEALGGTGSPVCADRVPALYDFQAGMDRFRTDPDPSATYDLIAVVDCGQLERVGSVLERHRDLFASVPMLNIDHHISNPGFGSEHWVDPESSATCEMVTLVAARLGVPLTAADGVLAGALMGGLVMDTATFQHPNVTPRTLLVGAALREAGAPLAEISRRLYRTKPDFQLRLFGRVLARLERIDGGRVVHSTLELADLAAVGATAEHSEGIIDLLSQSETAEVAILFKEGDGQTRISVRTRTGGVDATQLTGSFGGGGHARAAGATVDLPLPEARAAVLAEATRLAAAVAR